MSDADSQQRLLWTRHVLGDPAASLEVASADASMRSYYRVRSGERSLVLMDSPPAREPIGPWLSVGERLRAAGLRVPRVYQADPDFGYVLMEDFGTRLYQDALDESSADALYGAAMDALARMHRDCSTDGLPVFDAAWATIELELMPTWFLQRHLGLRANDIAWDVVAGGFAAVLAALDGQPRVFMHRDFHSRNLMVLDADGPGILDFQGAMRGPLAYDLASLLRDCYLSWPDERVAGWVAGQHARLQAAGLCEADLPTFQTWFDLAGLQRHLKVLGIFCRLAYRDDKPGYLPNLPLVFDYVTRIGGRYEATRPLVSMLAAAVGERDLTALRPEA